ncbi:MAG: hypothetical protein FJ264_04685 [Planctomycetes bacterium]|nr:hypothetical protein [Planctomycetota bacterium]
MNYKTLITIGVPIFISACALGVSIYQALSTRKHQRLLAKPKLFIAFTHDDIPREICKLANDYQRDEGYFTQYELLLKNWGAGVAYITKFLVKYDGTVLKNNIPELVLRIQNMLGLPPIAVKVERKDCTYPFAIANNETEILFKIGLNRPVLENLNHGGTVIKKKAITSLENLTRIEIEYESIYGEKFKFYYPEKRRTGRSILSRLWDKIKPSNLPASSNLSHNQAS